MYYIVKKTEDGGMTWSATSAHTQEVDAQAQVVLLQLAADSWQIVLVEANEMAALFPAQ